jgi:iron complex transport system permease protein
MQIEKRRFFSAQLMLLILSICLIFVILVAVSFGPIAIPLSDIIQIILNGTHLFHFSPSWDSSIELIIWQIRLPSVIAAACVGAALAVAGTLFQGMLRNPLADPFLIGTSSGAALGASIAFVLPLATFYGTFSSLTPVLAFVGAMITVLLVYAIANADGRTPVVTLLLAGVVMNAVLVAFQTLILTLAPRSQFTVQTLYNWLAGGVEVVGWPPVLIVGCIILVAMLLSLSFSGVLDVFGLGEESASHLGLRVEWYKFLIVIVASLLTAAAVSISGLIGFVGLVTPHVMRLLLGPKHRALLPTTALAGAIFLVLADLLARTLVPATVLPVGIFTALVGAPFFLFLLRKSKRDYTW